MICSEKERETCEVEKRGCDGCYYNKPREEEIKNDLAALSFTHPMFTTMINNTLLYIDYLEQENAKHKKINEKLRKKEQETKKALELINSYIAEILKK